jgi:hypothetical protein
MEYSTIFGQFDWNTVRRGKFQGKRGNFMSIARIIYNGLSYNFGSQDGAVTIMDGFTIWRFIAPVDRFSMADYAEMTLHETLEEIIKETEAVPVPAWDEFFSFLGGREDLANAAILGNDVIRIGGVKVNFPMIQNCSDFCTFMHWLSDNVGEAGNLAAGDFIDGYDMTIPLELYSAVPVSVTLKTPTMKPAFDEDSESVPLFGGIAMFGKTEGFAQPVFTAILGTAIYVYAFEETSWIDVPVPQGWSIVEDISGDIAFTPYDMEANPVTIPIENGEGLEISSGEKIFGDVEYDESTEVLDGTISFLFRT